MVNDEDFLTTDWQTPKDALLSAKSKYVSRNKNKRKVPKISYVGNLISNCLSDGMTSKY